jgi:uncharacterized protein
MSEPRPVEVADNPGKNRYEARVDGEVAGYVFYRSRPDRLVLLHTEVGEEFEGHGVGGKLVAGTLEDIRERGLRVTVLCPFAAAYIERHPEYSDLVAA